MKLEDLHSYYQLTKRYEMGKKGRDGLLEKSMEASKKKLEFLDLSVGLLFNIFFYDRFFFCSSWSLDNVHHYRAE